MDLEVLQGTPAVDSDVSEIKNEFHPSNTANVIVQPFGTKNNCFWYNGVPIIQLGSLTLYVNSSIGVDDVDNGYGYSAEKPFATLEYMVNYIPRVSYMTTNIEVFGDYSSTSFKWANIYPYGRISITFNGNTFTNIGIRIDDRSSPVFISIKGTVTFNFSDTTSTGIRAIGLSGDTFNVSGDTGSSIVINGNTTNKSNIFGIEIYNNAMLRFSNNNTTIEINNTARAFNVYGSSLVSLYNVSGTGNNVGLNATNGGIITAPSDASISINATTKKQQANGGRIFVGAS